jgi:hypothetical protein
MVASGARGSARLFTWRQERFCFEDRTGAEAVDRSGLSGSCGTAQGQQVQM